MQQKIRRPLWWLIVWMVLLPTVIFSRPSRAQDKIPTGLTPLDAVEVERFAETFFRERTEAYDGVALAVVQQGEIIFQKGYGYADQAATLPVDPERTIFNAASVGKLFVVTAVMHLYEQGLIDLNDDVNQYFTNFQLNTDAFHKPVTIAHLLTHTAGIESVFLGAEVKSEADMISMGDYFTRHTPSVILPPGDFVSYSNHGMALAGYLVEVVAGMPFYEYAEQHIFVPLGMDHSSFRQPLPPTLKDNMAYSEFAEFTLPYPSATLMTTAHDMANFMLAQLNGGVFGDNHILQPATIAEMQRQQVTHHPGMPGIGYGFFEDFDNGQRALFHTGLRFHSSVLFLLPEHKTGFYLVGSIPEGQSLKKEFVQAFLEHFYPQAEIFSLPTPPPDFNERADRFVGFYRFNNVPKTKIEKLMGLGAETLVTNGGDGTLWIRLPVIDNEPKPIVEVEPGLFRSADGAYIAFKEDETGQIRAMFIGGHISDVSSLSRIPWYESGIFNLLLGTVGLLLFASFILVSVLGWTIRWFRKTLSASQSSTARLAWRWAFVVSLLTILSPVSLVVWLITNGGPNLDGIPPIFYLVTGLVSLSAVLGIGLPLFCFWAWRYLYWSLGTRLYFSLLTLTTIIMVPFLTYWNLLGFHF